MRKPCFRRAPIILFFPSPALPGSGSLGIFSDSEETPQKREYIINHKHYTLPVHMRTKGYIKISELLLPTHSTTIIQYYFYTNLSTALLKIKEPENHSYLRGSNRQNDPHSLLRWRLFFLPLKSLLQYRLDAFRYFFA